MTANLTGARRPGRYLRDPDVLHAAAITLLAVFASAGLVWLAYLLRTCWVAVRSPLRPAVARTTLVFGRRLRYGMPDADYRARLDRALALMRAGLAPCVLLLGGCSDGGATSEAAAGAVWLHARGMPTSVALRLEQESVDSLENLRHARALLRAEHPEGPLPPVALVSSRTHLARCLWLAARLGFDDAVPVAAESRLPLGPYHLLQLLGESGYLMWIDLGVRWARLIGHARMAARID